MERPHDPLPSWHEGKAKQSILDFVQQVTSVDSEFYVEKEHRIATFDNDGTLWVEKPVLAQLAFYKREIFNNQPHSTKGVIAHLLYFLDRLLGDVSDVIKKVSAYLHSGLTTEEYRQYVDGWIAQAKHPRFNCLYTDLAYQPMLELLAYLAEHGFSNYIVSGGTANFIRPWSERVYKISADRVIGSSVKTRLSERNGRLVVKLEPIPFFLDYRSGKVLGIERALAKRPIAAFGNSIGDVEMLRWAGSNKRSLCMLIHHTDAEREYKYKPDPFYHLGKSTLSHAKQYQWQVVDMKTDWKNIFSFE
ncbi:HAD family hydrolase [Colwelliaceae bacterium 6471]